MTNRERYVLEVDGIRAGAALKQRTLAALEEARKNPRPTRSPAARPAFPPRAAALAAAVCLVALGSFLALRLADPGNPAPMGPGPSPAPPASESAPASESGGEGQPGDLPRLPLDFTTGGMGFEGLMARDVEELRTGNPWYEGAELAAMPVFRNAALANEAGETLPGQGFSREELTAFGEKLMSALGDRAAETEWEGGCLELRGERYETDLYEDGSVRITLAAPQPLPAGLLPTQAKTREDWAAILDHLWPGLQKLGEAAGITDPGYILWGDYNYFGKKNWQTQLFQKDSDLTQAILNYNFHNMRLAISSEDPSESEYSDTLWLIWLTRADLSQKVGDYPILTAAEARELLLSGRYLTTVPEEELGEDGVTEENISMVELVYRTESMQEYFMPFYRFLVALPRNPDVPMAEGLTTYGAYYVPAIPEGYLEPSDTARLFFN